MKNKINLKEQGKIKGYVVYETTKTKENDNDNIVLSTVCEFQSSNEVYDLQSALEAQSNFNISKRVFETKRDIISITVYTQVQDTEFKIMFKLNKYEQIKFDTFLRTIVDVISNEVRTGSLKMTLLSFDNIYLLSAFSDARELMFKDYNTYRMKRSILTKGNKYLKGNYSDDNIKNCFKVITQSRNSKFVKVKLRDAAVLMDKREITFTKLGEEVGITRKTLKLDEVRDLRAFSDKDENSYFEYEYNISEIIYKWTEESYGANIPETLSKHAENFAYTYLKEKFQSKNLNDFTRKYSGKRTVFNRQNKRSVVKYNTGFEEASDFARRSYYGGLNNAYTVGMFFDKTYDVDIRQAYITAIYLLQDINFYKKPEDISNINPEEIKVNDYAFVKADVSYPENFKHPCLPVKSQLYDTTVFVKEATNVFLSAPEIWYAVQNGAKVKIKSGYRLTKKKSSNISDLSAYLIKERNKLKDNPLKEKIQKLTNNMIYGNIAKGVTVKHENFLYGKITNEYYASTLTSLIRVLLSQTMVFVEQETKMTKNDVKAVKRYTGVIVDNREVKGTIYEAVTDGFVTNLTEEEVNEVMNKHKDNDIIKLFLNGRKRLGNMSINALKGELSKKRKELRQMDKRQRAKVNDLKDEIDSLKHNIKTIDNIYEVKHKQDILYVGRTRHGIGINFNETKDSVMTLANMSYPKQARLKARQDTRLFILHMVLNRKEEELVSIYQTIPRIEKYISNEKLDISITEKERRANLEYDHKRAVDEIKEININLIKLNERQIKNGNKEYETFQMTTKPHKNLDEFERYRKVSSDDRDVLTTKQDFIDFYSKVEYRESEINIRSDINTLNAKQILILLKKGVLVDKEERPGTELIKEVEDLFGVKLSYNNDYARAKNKRRLINFDFLMSDIRALNLTKA